MTDSHLKTKIQESNFLVTGAAGFIGSNIVEYLLTNKAGHVIGLDNFSTGSPENIKGFSGEPNFTFIEGDITNLETCMEASKNVDYILHQAALGSVPRSIIDPITTNHTNITGFLNILLAAKDNKIKRFIYAASSSTYGDSKELPKVEDKIGKPLSPYAVTKYVNELYADVFSKTYSIETIGLRYFNVFGPRQNPNGAYAAVIPRFIQNLLSGNPISIEGDGEQSRDFTYIDNVVQANIKAVFSEIPDAANQVYNVAVGDRHTVNDLFRLLADLHNSKSQPIYINSRMGDVRNSLADISKANKLLGYQPSVRFKDGIAKTYHWYRNIFEKTLKQL